MPRYYREADGMEPRLEFQLTNGNTMVILLPIGEKWTEELIEITKTRPEVVLARINAWNGEMILDLQAKPTRPHTVKAMREDN